MQIRNGLEEFSVCLHSNLSNDNIISAKRPGLKTGMDCRGLVWKRVWKTTFFGLKSGQDLENQAAHPHQEFPGVPPPTPGLYLNPLFYFVSLFLLTDVSSDLVTHLQVRDDLRLQKNTMKVTVGKLVHLQSNIKTSSAQDRSRSTNTTKHCPNNVIITWLQVHF